MEIYVTEFSRYLITLFLALYTFESIMAFRNVPESKKNGLYTRQAVLMFCVHFSCFLVICFQTGEIKYLFFYIFQQILLFATVMLFHMLYPSGNRLVINNMCMLLSIGFIILTRLSYDKAIKQFFIVTISIAIGMIIPYFIHKLKFLNSLTWIYGAGGIFLLGLVLALGSITNGSKISYSIGGITFQPSEFVKILYVFFLASALYESQSLIRIALVSVFAGAHVLILVLSKDLGSALIYFIVYVFMVFIASRKLIYLILGLGGGTCAAIVAYKMFSHVQVRVEAFLDPWSTIDSTGYQITQSLFAISSGGWFGLGLFNGEPTAIPYVEDDFVFSAVAQELGIVFAMLLLVICLTSFISFMNIAMKLRNRFYQLIAFGLGICYIFQVFLTVGGGTKFIPMTGVTLPFVSYGGSSVLSTLIMFFIIDGLYILRQDEGIADAERKRIIARKKTEERRNNRSQENGSEDEAED